MAALRGPARLQPPLPRGPRGHPAGLVQVPQRGRPHCGLMGAMSEESVGQTRATFMTFIPYMQFVFIIALAKLFLLILLPVVFRLYRYHCR